MKTSNNIRCILCTLILLLSTISTLAQKKGDGPSKEQIQLWQQIYEAAENENEELTLSLCRTLICKSKLDDSLALRCRHFLSSYYLQENDYEKAINGLWEQYVFFKKYSESYPLNEEAIKTKQLLKKRYDELIKSDQSKPYLEGIYFSELQERNLPLLTLDISIGPDNRPTIQILPTCEMANISKAYKKSGKSKNTFGEKTYLNQDSASQVLVAFWGDQKYRKAQTELAKVFINEAANLKIGTAKTISSAPNISLSDHLLVNLTTGLISLGFEAIANSLSQIKIQAQGLTLSFENSSTDFFNAHLIYDAEVYKTGENEIKKIHLKQDFKMYKMRPHYNLYFGNMNNYSVLCSYGIINDENSNAFLKTNLLDKQYNPISIENADISKNQSISIHKMLKIAKYTANRFPLTPSKANTFSYLNFYLNNTFLQIDSIDFLKPLPPTIDMNINIKNDNTINIFYINKRKKKPYVSFSAIKESNGDIGYYQLNEIGEKDGAFIIYKQNGEIIRNDNSLNDSIK